MVTLVCIFVAAHIFFVRKVLADFAVQYVPDDAIAKLHVT